MPSGIQGKKLYSLNQMSTFADSYTKQGIYGFKQFNGVVKRDPPRPCIMFER